MTIITKEKIIEMIELHSVGRHFGEYREITHEDCECIADELLALIEQEKKEEQSGSTEMANEATM